MNKKQLGTSFDSMCYNTDTIQVNKLTSKLTGTEPCNQIY